MSTNSCKAGSCEWERRSPRGHLPPTDSWHMSCRRCSLTKKSAGSTSSVPELVQTGQEQEVLGSRHGHVGQSMLFLQVQLFLLLPLQTVYMSGYVKGPANQFQNLTRSVYGRLRGQ